MKVLTPEIAWHQHGESKVNKPIFGVSFHPKENIFATAGGDNVIILWRLNPEPVAEAGAEQAEGEKRREVCSDFEFIFALEGHRNPVNCVRFSPDGRYLASADTDGVILWSRRGGSGEPEERLEWGKITAEKDFCRTHFSGNREEVADLSWSPCSRFLVSGSVDNTATLRAVPEGTTLLSINKHSNYVQGVTWHPWDAVVATQSSDRTVAVHKLHIERKVTKKNEKKLLAVSLLSSQILSSRAFSRTQEEKRDAILDTTAEQIEKESEGKERQNKEKQEEEQENPTQPPVETKARVQRQHKMFLGESLNSFFRCPSWTPDGSFLITPAGRFQSEATSEPVNTTYIFKRSQLNRPAMHLPHSKPSVAVRCCPVFFKRMESKKEHMSEREDVQEELFTLPYRMIFAVITLGEVFIYDTQHALPLILLSGQHYGELTDADWSKDGTELLITSADGYCSLVRFNAGELGEKLDTEELPGSLRSLLESARRKMDKQTTADEEDRTRCDVAVGKERKKAEGKPPVTVKKKIVPELIAKPTQHEEVEAKEDAPQDKPRVEPATQSSQQKKEKRRITPQLVVPSEREEMTMAPVGGSSGTKDSVDNVPIGETSPQKVKGGAPLEPVSEASPTAAGEEQPRKKKRITPTLISVS